MNVIRKACEARMKPWGLLPGIAGLAALSALMIHSALAMGKEGGPGAAVPWTTYEAEQATISGTVLGPDYTGHTPAREASGRRCIRLSTIGQFLEFTAKADAQGIVVRYCIPDSAD